MGVQWPGPVSDGTGLYNYEDNSPRGGMGKGSPPDFGVQESPQIKQAEPGPESPKQTGYKEGQYGGGD